MKARKLNDVEFSITPEHSGGAGIDVVWQRGQLFLSLRDVLLTDGEIWYELSVGDLEKIAIVSQDPLKLEFILPSLRIIIGGDSAQKLLTLRHFLLPYIKGTDDNFVDRDRLKSFVKFWVMDIRNPDALANLLGAEKENVELLHKHAVDEGYLKDDGLTDKGKAIFSNLELNLLKTGGFL